MNDPTERDPSEFPRRVLLCTVGMSPAVVTETLWALAHQDGADFIPTEIHCLTTTTGAAHLNRHFVEGGVFRSYVEQYGPPELARALVPGQFHIPEGPDGPLADIQNDADNDRLADLTTQLIRHFTRDPDCALHVSIAGGRKTMTFLGGYVLSIFARPQDRLSHVLVDPRFEAPGFFFPPKMPQTITLRGQELNTADADIKLAVIPFVRLDHFLRHNPIAGEVTYSDVVAMTQRRIDTPRMIFDLGARRLTCQGIAVDLDIRLFNLAAYLAKRVVDEDDTFAGAVSYDEFCDAREQTDLAWIEKQTARDVFAADIAQERRHARQGGVIARGTFHSYVSQINRALDATLGELSERYRIKSRGRGTQSVGFNLEPGQIKIR